MESDARIEALEKRLTDLEKGILHMIRKEIQNYLFSLRRKK